MNKTRIAEGSIAFLGILCFILDGKTVLTGAQAGIDLCIKAVIPSLFPFFLLSIILSNTLSGRALPILRPLTKSIGMPQGTESILLIGFLGGYPTGAQAVASVYHSDYISKPDADRLLSFCNNAGPAFLFGMVGPMFSEGSAPFLLWGIHIVSALLVAALIPGCYADAVSPVSSKKIKITQAMHTSLVIMATVCGWVIAFRVILAFLDHWFLWMFPTIARTAVYAVLELSNGCFSLGSIPDQDLRFVLCSGMLAWGGLCVAMQTAAVTEGLSMAAYLKGKLLQTLFSLLLSASVVLNIGIPVTAFLAFFVILLRKAQKRGSNPALIGI